MSMACSSYMPTTPPFPHVARVPPPEPKLARPVPDIRYPEDKLLQQYYHANRQVRPSELPPRHMRVACLKRSSCRHAWCVRLLK